MKQANYVDALELVISFVVKVMGEWTRLVRNSPMIFPCQRTFRKPFHVTGIGLHSGLDCGVQFSPMPAYSGILVQIGAGAVIPLSEAVVVKTPRCTRLSDAEGNSVDTPEHLLAALAISKIDNCIIRFHALEVPILDGCSVEWLQHINVVGVIDHRSPSFVYEVTDHFEFSEGNSSYTASPGATRVVVAVDFAHPVIGSQFVDVSEDQFSSLASSRTFVLEADIARLKAAGLALGGSLDNAIVIGDTDVINLGGFRFENECARHKALDLIGDMYVLAAPVCGIIRASRPSHSANASFVAALKASGVLQRRSIDFSVAA